MSTETLTLAQIARLAHVQRPVVTIWRQRPVAGHPFPTPNDDGRFDAAQVLDWLQATGRGNNPEARMDLALQTVLTPDADVEQLRALLALVATRSLLGEPLSSMDPEEVLDRVEELDADDEWVWREVEEVEIDALAPAADALVDAAWNLADAHDRLVDALARRAPDHARPDTLLVRLLAALAKALLAPGSELVDVAGTACDVVAELLRDEDLPDVPVTLPTCGRSPRLARQRMEVRGVHPRIIEPDDDWDLAPHSVVLAMLPRDEQAAFDLLDELALNLSPSRRAVVLGPASVLVDELDESSARRDALVRDGLVQAVVRLPQGLLREGLRGHLGLWVMARDHGSESRVADLSSRPLHARDAQDLLDDLVAAALGDRRRAHEFLHPTSLPSLLTARSLVALGHTFPVELAPAAADEAVRMHQLLGALAAPMTDPTAGLAPRVVPHARQPATLSLGDAARSRAVRVLPGSRLDAPERLPAGSTRLWTAEALAGEQSVRGVDLLSLTREAPKAALTRPDDVVFCTVGRPRAVVDASGGSAVACPARVLRVSPTASLSPRAIAAAINALPAGSGSWRGWQVPVAFERAAGEDVLRLLDEWDRQLTERQNVVDELRQVTIRSVLSGMVRLTASSPEDDEKGL